MKRLEPSAFPELRRVFAGYLHEDFAQEHGTPSEALRAFLADADRSERDRFLKEARQLLARTATLDFTEVRQLIANLGCRWIPPSREAWVALFASATDPASDGHRP